MSVVFISRSPSETEALAQRLAPLFKAGDVLAFLGDLGAGKTAFVRGLARGMDSPDAVSSPTFVLMHIYRGRLPIYHFDAYRLQSGEDLYDIGAEEYIFGDGLSCLEWSENVSDFLPADRLQVAVSHLFDDPQPDSRRFEFTALGKRSREILDLAQSQDLFLS